MMSMNISFEADRVIQVVETGTTDIQRQTYEVWQTPTAVTYKIVDSDDPVQAYKAWVMEQPKDLFNREIFAEDDVWGERGPVRIEQVDLRAEHLAEFDAWVQKMQADSWTIKPVIL